MEEADAKIALAERQAMASANAGIACCDGMVDRTLAATWKSVDDASNQAERQRQALQRQQKYEVNALANAGEDHRRKVVDLSANKKRILDEMRVVRNKMQEKVVAASARASHNAGIANRALALAGQSALTARGEAERWQARAQDVESRFAAAAARDPLAKFEEATKARVTEGEARFSEREQFGQRLVQEAALQSEQARQCDEDHCLTQEHHARRAARIKMQRAEAARQDASDKVRSAAGKSSKEQLACISDIKKSAAAAGAKVMQANQDLWERRTACEAVLDNGQLCAAQANKIAHTLKVQQVDEVGIEISRLEAKLEFASAQAQTKVSHFEFETELAAQRNEAWEDRCETSKASAQERVGSEEELVESRLVQAKISLAKLQAQSAAYLRNLHEQRDEAKREDAAKVDAATARLEELVRFCEETLQTSEKYCKEALRNTESHAKAKKEQLEQKVSTMDDLAKQRVAMMQRQSKQRREQAEAQLADFLAYVEEMRSQCADRVRVEAATSEEKVDLARQRFNDAVALAERRQAEAEARRDAARAAHAAVMGRCIGSAMEARRRGLNNIAQVIEPEPPKRYPGWDTIAEAPVEAEAKTTFASGDEVTSGATCDKDVGLMGTGLTAASTTAPEDFMASLATSNEVVP
jgi:hypothetical protein